MRKTKLLPRKRRMREKGKLVISSVSKTYFDRFPPVQKTVTYFDDGFFEINQKELTVW